MRQVYIQLLHPNLLASDQNRFIGTSSKFSQRFNLISPQQYKYVCEYICSNSAYKTSFNKCRCDFVKTNNLSNLYRFRGGAKLHLQLLEIYIIILHTKILLQYNYIRRFFLNYKEEPCCFINVCVSLGAKEIKKNRARVCFLNHIGSTLDLFPPSYTHPSPYERTKKIVQIMFQQNI